MVLSRAQEGRTPELRQPGFKPVEKRVRTKREVVDHAAIAEQKRRAEIGRIAQTATALDHEWARSLKPGVENPGEAIRYFEKMESLAFGRKIDEKQLGVSQGAVSRCVLAGDQPQVAYEKLRSGESFYRYDATKDLAVQVRRTWDAKKQTFNLKEEPIEAKVGKRTTKEMADKMTKEIAKAIREKVEKRERSRTYIADYYGVPVEEVPGDFSTITADNGLFLDQGFIREYTVSRFNELIGWDTTPLTVLRAKEDNHDISSMQEAVLASDPQQPLRLMDQGLYDDLKEQGPEHPAAKSFMRLACFDYLIGSTDRSPDNLFYDPGSQKITGIDNARSFSLSGRVNGKDKRLDRYVSIPMQVIQSDSRWQLDDEARNSLKQFYDRTISYALKKKEKSRGQDLEAAIANLFQTSDDDPNDRELNHVLKLFQMMFGHEKIAGREAVEFFKRINYIVVHGRPPHFELGSELGDKEPKDSGAYKEEKQETLTN